MPHLHVVGGHDGDAVFLPGELGRGCAHSAHLQHKGLALVHLPLLEPLHKLGGYHLLLLDYAQIALRGNEGKISEHFGPKEKAGERFSLKYYIKK